MALGSAKRMVAGTRSKPGFCLLYMGWELSLCFTKHFQEMSSKSGSSFALCNSHVLSKPTADHKTLVLKSFFVFKSAECRCGSVKRRSSEDSTQPPIAPVPGAAALPPAPQRYVAAQVRENGEGVAERQASWSQRACPSLLRHFECGSASLEKPIVVDNSQCRKVSVERSAGSRAELGLDFSYVNSCSFRGFYCSSVDAARW